MDFVEAQRTLIDEFRQQWHETDAAYDNTYYKPAEGVDEWVRLSVREGSSFNAALGKVLVRHPGLIIVQIFTRAGSGTVRAAELAQMVADLYHPPRTDGIRCYQTSAITVGERNGWHQVNAQTDFDYDEVKAA